jgi:hypothetical protein
MSRIALVRLLALLGVFLVLGAALCVFDDGDTSDLCLLSLALLAGALALSPLTVVGRLEPRPVWAYPSLLADLPAPPPKA